MIPRFEDIARRSANDRLADMAEREAERVREQYAQERQRRARRGDKSYTQNPARFPAFI